MIPFNKPFIIGNELKYIEEAVKSGKISGDGLFTRKCHEFLQNKYGFQKVLLTTSCTDALEMAAILCNIQKGDEVIVPSYTFVSTANAFVLRGAKIVFADSCTDNPNIDPNKIEPLITPKTKAIAPVHYAGVACDMDKIMALADKYNLYVIEDAAQALDSFYTNKHGEKKPLGSIGHLSTFSFHETKNVIAGEGGMLVINDPQFNERAEIIREKGTNRSAFFRGEVNKYGWVDIGSSFLPSEIISAFLYGQLEHINEIQSQRTAIWNKYYQELIGLKKYGIKLPDIPLYATNNAHMFYLVFNSIEERSRVIEKCKHKNIYPVFHYLSLHKSPYFSTCNQQAHLPFSDFYTDTLLRLPLYFELSAQQQKLVVETIYSCYE